MKNKIIPIHRDHENTESSELSDEAVAAASGTGDQTAITMLFNRYNVRIARYIQSINGTQDLEDLVQATFLEIVKGNTVYDGRASVSTWLFAIATNIVRNYRRTFTKQMKVQKALSKREPEAVTISDANMDIKRRASKVQKAINSLKSSQKEAFVLCVLEGLSAREVALILDTSEAAIWKRVCKARENIRSKVGGE